MKTLQSRFCCQAIAVLSTLSLAACGGGGGGGDTSAPAPSVSTSSAAAAEVSASAVTTLASVDSTLVALPDASLAAADVAAEATANSSGRGADFAAIQSASIDAATAAAQAAAPAGPAIDTLAVNRAAADRAVRVAAVSNSYYVDPATGDDSYAGTASLVGAGNGPWRTLARLAAVTLLPGDSVLLRCGAVWNETLRFGGSGTVAAPIRVGAYPSNCATPPAIDGRSAVAAANWKLHAGSIYKVNLNPNLVPNGMLALGTKSWARALSPVDTTLVYDATCAGAGFGCLNFVTGSGAGGGTLYSPTFGLTNGLAYSATLKVLVPAGVAYSINLRRTLAPGTLGGLAAVSRVGTGAWESLALTLTPDQSVPDARLDVGVSGTRTSALVRDMSVTLVAASLPVVTQLFENNVGVTVAHHPNQGHNPAAPGSYYLSTAAASTPTLSAVGRSVSQDLVVGSDLKLPPGASITPDLSVTLRSSDWTVSTHAVSSFASGKLAFSPATSYALSSAGWGYFLTGALWMLDSPGEWFYDAASTTLYVQTSTSAAPADTLAYSALDLGADLKGKSYVTLTGLDFRRTQLGVDMSNSTGAQLQSVRVSQSGGNGVLGVSAVNPVVSNSSISDTGADAVLAHSSTGLQATGNDNSNSGVRLRADGSPATLPSAVWGAIMAGNSALVRDNRLKNLAFNGVTLGSDGSVVGNAVQSFCLLLNDCAAVYTYGAARVAIQDNLLMDGRGGTLGAPAGFLPHSVGIYLDLHTNASTVSGNTVANAEWGVQFHDAYNNSVSNNLFYGNRVSQILFQQLSNSVNPSQGDVFGNSVRGNNFFPTNGNVSINQTTSMASAAAMASYDFNRYSTLLSPTVAAEGSGGGSRTYSFAEWQAALGPNGARALDTNGRIAAPLAGRAIGTMGAEQMIPGNLAIGSTVAINGWGRGGSPAAPTLSQGNCPVGIAACIRATVPAGSTGLMSSPKVGAVKDTWYRLSFDAVVSAASQPISVAVRNASTYATISPTFQAAGSTAWKRYSFLFQMRADAPMTSNSTGARIDFQGIQSGQWLSLANLSLVPVTAAAGDVPYTLLTNTSRTPQFAACPVADPVACANHYSFADSTPVTWPARLDPLKALVVFAPVASLVDSDNDGIADAQDACPGTPAGAAVDNRGCPVGQ